MFRRLLIFGLFFLFVANPSKGQELTMDGYTNQLFLNILTEHPDSSITGFLKLYIPSLYDKKKTNALSATDTFYYHEEIHSFLFTHHPFLNVKFVKGKLDIHCKRYNSQELIQNITNIKLWFEFDDQQEAEIAFSRLVDNFILLSTDKKFGAANGAQKAEFLNSKNTKGFNRVQFRLTIDNVAQHRYKILFETGNTM